MVRVSVIVPAYNATEYVRDAVESVRNQTMQDFEVVVIDDRSTDATPDIVSELAAQDRRVKLVRLESNVGPGAARNRGFEEACGEWFALLDADDRFHPERLQELLVLGAGADADMVADNLLLRHAEAWDDAAPMLPSEWLADVRVLDAAAFVQGNIGAPGEARLGFGFLHPMIRRSFLRESGVRYDELRFSEDYIFTLRCLLKGAKWVVTPRAMYDYRVTASSLTSRHSALDLARLCGVEQEILAGIFESGDAPLISALQRHLRSVELALAWFRFAEAVKRRDVAGAAKSAFRDPVSFGHIIREGMRAMPRAWGRMAGYGRS